MAPTWTGTLGLMSNHRGLGVGARYGAACVRVLGLPATVKLHTGQLSVMHMSHADDAMSLRYQSDLVAGRQSNGLHSLPDTHLIRQEQPALALHPEAHALSLEW